MSEVSAIFEGIWFCIRLYACGVIEDQGPTCSIWWRLVGLKKLWPAAVDLPLGAAEEVLVLHMSNLRWVKSSANRLCSSVAQTLYQRLVLKLRRGVLQPLLAHQFKLRPRKYLMGRLEACIQSVSFVIKDALAMIFGNVSSSSLHIPDRTGQYLHLPCESHVILPGIG